MKQHIMVAALLPLLVIALAGVSQAGQREMAPYGLLQYGTAFLTYTSNVAQGEEIRFYDDYRFTYTGVTGWGSSLDQFNTVGTFTDYALRRGEFYPREFGSLVIERLGCNFNPRTNGAP